MRKAWQGVDYLSAGHSRKGSVKVSLEGKKDESPSPEIVVGAGKGGVNLKERDDSWWME